MRIHVRSSRGNRGSKYATIVFMVVGTIFLFVGISQILSGVFLLKNSGDNEDYVEISAVISDIIVEQDSDGEYDHEVYLTYTYDGVTYENKRFNMYDSSMYEGKEIDILCDPENPEKITSKFGLKLPAIILFIIGGLFTFVSIIVIIVMICTLKKPKETKDKLEKKGMKVKATVEEIQRDDGFATGEYGYRIICVYNDEKENVMYRYKSDILVDDPSSYYYKGASIEVLINPEDYSEYHVIVEHIQTRKIVDFV